MHSSLRRSRVFGLSLLAAASGCEITGTFEPAETVEAAYDNLPSEADAAVFSAYTARSRWQKQDLNYYIHNVALGITAQRQSEIMAEAVDAWAQVTPLTFSEVGSPDQADFLVGFGPGMHCDLYHTMGLGCGNDPFEGPNGVLAHAYYPGQGTLSGEAHFDAGEAWSDAPFGGVSLLSVAMHEFGHSLGLEHSSDIQALMYPSYSGSNPKLGLAADDIAGIQSLYGSNGSQPPPPPQPPMTPPTIQPCSSPVPGDADGDGVGDFLEIYQLGTNPNACDTDQDGLSDFEAAYGLNPLNPDTDGDGVSDGDEVQQGSNPFVPDQGGVTPTFVGTYSGTDSFGSPLSIEVFPNGSASGVLRIIWFGAVTNIALTGGIDAFGNLLLVSWDYFFAYAGTFVTGGVQGNFQTAGGAFGTWSVTKTGSTTADLVDELEGRPLVEGDRYHPPLGERVAPTFLVHHRVDWRSPEGSR